MKNIRLEIPHNFLDGQNLESSKSHSKVGLLCDLINIYVILTHQCKARTCALLQLLKYYP
jgi:hypothetical protein